MSHRHQQGRAALLPLLVLAALGIAAWYLLRPAPTPLPAVAVSEQVPPAVVTAEPVQPPADVLTAAPPVTDPVVEQAADEGAIDVGAETVVASVPALPALDESDAWVKQELLALKWRPGLASLFVTDEMIRRFVVQIDNIAQGRLLGDQAFFKGLSQDFIARTESSGYRLAQQNYQRYQPYLDLLESVPPAQVAALYQKLYPLLQAAYQELGYGDAQFDERLQQAIALLLATPDIADEPQLTLPSVHYAFADAQVEKLGQAQKQVVRLGKNNASRFKRLLMTYQPLLKRPR